MPLRTGNCASKNRIELYISSPYLEVRTQEGEKASIDESKDFEKRKNLSARPNLRGLHDKVGMTSLERCKALVPIWDGGVGDDWMWNVLEETTGRWLGRRVEIQGKDVDLVSLENSGTKKESRHTYLLLWIYFWQYIKKNGKKKRKPLSILSHHNSFLRSPGQRVSERVITWNDFSYVCWNEYFQFHMSIKCLLEHKSTSCITPDQTPYYL